MRNDVPEKRLQSPLTRSSLLALLLAVVPGVAFGQGTLALSSGSATQGGSVALNLTLTSAAGSSLVGVQWTLTYAAGNIASIAVVAGSSATAAGKTITCFSSSGSYACLLSGMNDTVIQNGVVAVLSVTMTSSAVTTQINLTNPSGAAAAGSPVSITGTGGTVTLPTPPGAPAVIPTVAIDAPVAGSTVSGTVTVGGWAIDNASTVGTAIGSVHVLVDGTAVGTATYGVSRTDVCAAYPGRPGCPNVGYTYSLNTATLTPGCHTITVTATDSASPPDTGSASETITVTAGTAGAIPTVHIDLPAWGATVSGTVTVGGWAIDNASTVGTAIASVHVLVDGVTVGTATYGVSRTDVCAAYPGRPGCPNVGYSYSLNTATDRKSVV